MPGTVYKVARLIGSGGMGSVYDVEDTTIGKRYVLKTLHAQLGAREDLARRIQNEARTLARLHHPNIVEVITAGVTSDELRLPFYVMERLNGQSLRLVLEKKGRLELSHAYHIGIDLLDALDHAHDKGVIHRDVKPDNIFLHRTAAGVTVTKLLDFGIVSVLDAGIRETAGRFLGTLRYAAPEQLRGEKPTPRMDLYAAALVIYETIAGRGPFDDLGDGSRIAQAHVNDLPPPVSRFASVPKELEMLLAAALAKDPGVRPRDAFAFAASLRNLKRQLQGGALDSTENRATVPAVIGPEAATTGAPSQVTTAAAAQAAADAAQATTAAAQATTAAADAPAATGSRQTLLGMTAPASLAATEPAGSAAPGIPTATGEASVDRLTATRTSADGSAPAAPAARAGTEPIPGSDPYASRGELPTEDGVERRSKLPSSPEESLRWPDESAPARSEEPQPQVHSLPVVGVTPPPWRAAAAGLAVLGGLLAVAAVLVAAFRGPGASAAAPAASVVLPASHELPRPSPPQVAPAPTLAPPAFDDPAEPPRPSPPGSSAETAAPPAPVAPRRGKPAPSSVAAPRPTARAQASSRADLERPGPGF